MGKYPKGWMTVASINRYTDYTEEELCRLIMDSESMKEIQARKFMAELIASGLLVEFTERQGLFKAPKKWYRVSGLKT